MLAGRLHHYPLTGGAGTEILSWLDDHSRLALPVTAHHRVTGPIVVAEFAAAVARYGIPASTLTGNGMVFTTRLSGGKGGRNGLETGLRRLGVLLRELTLDPTRNYQPTGKPPGPKRRSP